jgi:hypothetical protein
VSGCQECGGPIEPDDLHGRHPDYCKGHQYLGTPMGQRFAQQMDRLFAERDGTARQCQWQAEDGWLIVYTTSRVEGGPDHGKFVAMAYKPNRRGKAATSWHRVYSRAFATRKAAKARATTMYYQHSPKARARHGVA